MASVEVFYVGDCDREFLNPHSPILERVQVFPPGNVSALQAIIEGQRLDEPDSRILVLTDQSNPHLQWALPDVDGFRLPPPGRTWPELLADAPGLEVVDATGSGLDEFTPGARPRLNGAAHEPAPKTKKNGHAKELPPAMNAPMIPQATRRYAIKSVSDVAALPPGRDRIKSVLPCEGVAAIYGATSSGKTFLGMDAAFSISEGADWFGYRVESCDVVIVSLEGLAGLAKRVQAYRERHGEARGARVHFITEPFRLLYTDDVDALIATLKDMGIRDGVIVIDTLNAATSGMDENSAADMGRAIDAAKRIQQELGGLVILIHHSGKDQTRGMRGHSSLPAFLDAAIEVSRDGSRREWKLAKAKDGADGEAHPFRLDVLEVGTDEQGDAITSCVVRPEERAADGVRRARVPAGGNQRLVWDALGELFRASPDFGKAGAPASRPCLELEGAIEKMRDRLATDPKRRTERVRAAITGLVSRGLLRLEAGWLWCV